MAISLPEIQLADMNCEQHGPYVAKCLIRDRWSGCPACTVEKDQAARERQELMDREVREHRLRSHIRGLKSNSGMIGRQFDCSLDNFKADLPAQQEALRACRDFIGEFQMRTHEGGRGKWLDSPSASLWLIGPPGTGKSHLGAAMVNHLIEVYQVGARMHSAREIVRLLRATWNKESPPMSAAFETANGGYVDAKPISEEKMISDIGTAPLLVLDEVGVGFGSEGELVQLFDVLDMRYRMEMPTVVLSNLNAGQLKQVLGDRIYDRLREGATVKPCNWASYRGEFPRLQSQKAA